MTGDSRARFVIAQHFKRCPKFVYKLRTAAGRRRSGAAWVQGRPGQQASGAGNSVPPFLLPRSVSGVVVGLRSSRSSERGDPAHAAVGSLVRSSRRGLSVRYRASHLQRRYTDVPVAVSDMALFAGLPSKGILDPSGEGDADDRAGVLHLGTPPGHAGAPKPGPHVASITYVTDVRIGTPITAPASTAGEWAASSGLLSLERSEHFVLRLTFDGASSGRETDLRPELPLALRW